MQYRFMSVNLRESVRGESAEIVQREGVQRVCRECSESERRESVRRDRVCGESIQRVCREWAEGECAERECAETE